MIYISRRVLKRNINKAREELLNRGILALDGSGDIHVESMFTYITLLIEGKLAIRKEDK